MILLDDIFLNWELNFDKPFLFYNFDT